jgi:hypothetical protein
VLQRKTDLSVVAMAQYYTVSTMLILHIAVEMASWDGGYARVRNVSLTPFEHLSRILMW